MLAPKPTGSSRVCLHAGVQLITALIRSQPKDAEQASRFDQALACALPPTAHMLLLPPEAHADTAPCSYCGCWVGATPSARLQEPAAVRQHTTAAGWLLLASDPPLWCAVANPCGSCCSKTSSATLSVCADNTHHSLWEVMLVLCQQSTYSTALMWVDTSHAGVCCCCLLQGERC